MEWREHRLSRRLLLAADAAERLYSMIAESDSVKISWRLTSRLMPQMIERLMQSVLVTSTWADPSRHVKGQYIPPPSSCSSAVLYGRA
jgi:hypothetical protein